MISFRLFVVMVIAGDGICGEEAEDITTAWKSTSKIGNYHSIKSGMEPNAMPG